MRYAAQCLILAVGLGTTACAADLTDEKPAVSDKKGGNGGKEDAYNRGNDNPNDLVDDLVHTFADLPTSGAATTAPWAGNYWPTYQDNINKRWDGDNPSATAKFAQWKGIDPAELENIVSRNYGIDSRTSATVCKLDSECDSETGEKCSKRRGKTEGRCVPTWFGICHAWAPVSTMIAEPKYPVTLDGVTFKVQDIKALLTLAWNRTSSKFVSSRCNKNGNDLNHDAYGNYRDDPECENTNPGTWHIIVTNMLGVRGKSFVYDRTFDSEVWNQPVRDFDITQNEEITALEANKLSGVTSAGGTTESVPSTDVAKGAWFHHPPMAVTAGDAVNVVMTGTTGDADLHVSFTGQPTDSRHDCRPYAGGSNENCEMAVPAEATQMWVSVKGYSAADFDLNMTVGGTVPTTYVHNDRAEKFFHVKMKVGYISESAAGTDGNLAHDIDRYTHYDNYEYLLEVKADGAIDGGVWLGDSRTTHPDFIWLATGARDASVANGKIRRADVMRLVELSYIDPNAPTDPGTGEQVELQKNGTVAKDIWVHYGPFTTKDGITVEMTGSNDADLYVRRNSEPSRIEGTYDCRPYKTGSTEKCTLTDAGVYYVSVNGWAASSDFDLKITYTSGNGTPVEPTDPTPTVVHLNETSTVDQGQMKYFTIDVLEGERIFINVAGNNDVDLYIQMNSQPTTSSFAERAWTTEAADQIGYTPTQSGKMHIGVYGYEASNFTLRTGPNSLL